MSHKGKQFVFVCPDWNKRHPASLLSYYGFGQEDLKANRKPWCDYQARFAPKSEKQLARESEAALKLYAAFIK